jgi:putative ABC transport system permease protein
MGFYKLALNSLGRRKTRTILTIGGVTLAIAVLVSLLGFNVGYKKALADNIRGLGYEVLVTAKGCPYEAATLILKGGAGLKFMDEETQKTIINDEEVEVSTPFFLFPSMHGDNFGHGGAPGTFTLFQGIEPGTFARLKPWLKFMEPREGEKESQWFSSGDTYEVIMGYEAAEMEQRKVGDEIFRNIAPDFGMEPEPVVFKVVGIFERSGTQDDGTLFIPLKTAQKLYREPGKLTGIGIKLKDFSKIEQFQERMYGIPETQVISLTQVQGTILGYVQNAQMLLLAITIIAVFIAAVGVVNAILMSVYERTGEIGIMKAVGASTNDIFVLIWLETMFVCLIGGILGAATGYFGSSSIEALIKKVEPGLALPGSIVTVTPQIIILSILGGLTLGFLAGIIPAYRACRMNPIEAIRTGE